MSELVSLRSLYEMRSGKSLRRLIRWEEMDIYAIGMCLSSSLNCSVTECELCSSYGELPMKLNIISRALDLVKSPFAQILT